MAIAPLPPIGAAGITGPAAARPSAPANGAGFADAMRKGLEQVSSLEQQADQVTQTLASGGPAQIHDVMVANTKAAISVDLLVQVRNRAVEAYQEVMRMPL
jgi:flagellar hook-basal body complex protein FliE